MKKNIMLVGVLLTILVGMPIVKAKDFDCNYIIQDDKETKVGYDIGGTVYLITYKGKSVNKSVTDKYGKNDTTKCYEYVGISVNKSHSVERYTYSLGDTSSDVKFKTSNNNAYAKIYDPNSVSDNKSTNTNNNKTQDSLVVTPVDVCSQDSGSLKAFQIVGYIILIIKILVPLILIVMGSIDFAKAAISSDADSSQKAAVKLGMRILTGLIIFFIPTALDFFLSLVSGVSETMSKYQNCTSCVLSPNNTSRCNPKGLGSK